MSRQITLDTETTGLDPLNGDRIVEIGCVEVIDRRITENHFHVYINPERDVPEDAVAIHGLTNEFLGDKPVFAAVAQDFCNFIKGAELIIHNASFDVGFLNAELKQAGFPTVDELATNVIDSLAMAKNMFPGKRNNLDALCERLEIDNSERTLHGALLDAELLADVYLRLTRGQNSLMIDNYLDAATTSDDGSTPIDKTPVIVLAASEDEMKEHEAVLDAIEKENKGKACIWRIEDVPETKEE